jgi:hypothetical protein
VFDGDLESKWLDFIAGPGKTNRTTWIEWRYIPRVKQHIINLRWLQGVSPQAAEPTRLSLEGIVLSWRPEDSLLGLLDDSGFQTLKLEGEGFDPNPGERIHLGGQLKFEQGRGVVKEAELTNLGLIASIDERHLDALSASGPKFAFGSITGIVTFISANQTSFRTENGGRFLVKVPNPGHLQNNILVPGCRYRVEGIIQSILNQYVEMAAGVVWVPDMDHVTPEIVSESDWGKWPK